MKRIIKEAVLLRPIDALAKKDSDAAELAHDLAKIDKTTPVTTDANSGEDQTPTEMRQLKQ